MSDLRNRKGSAPSTPKAGSGASTPKAGVVPPLASASSDFVGAYQLIKSNNTAIHGTFLEKYERFIPWILLVLCGATRFWRLDKPGGVVFDETHFGRFTNQYLAGNYLFDIHPPLGKLVFYVVCQLTGYDWTQCGYANISDEYGPDCKFMVLRYTAASFGTLTAPMFYFIVRNWGGSIYAALLASVAFITDGLNTTEDRLILTDSQLMFWIAAALLTAQMWWRRYNDHHLAVLAWKKDQGAARNNGKPFREPTSSEMAKLGSYGGYAFHLHPARNWWCVFAGVVFANAISIKWTGLATPGLIALESFFAVFFLHRSVDFADLLKVGAVSFATYANWFYWHFWLLPKTGDGDAFMKIDFQRTLEGSFNYDPLAPRPGFWQSFAYVSCTDHPTSHPGRSHWRRCRLCEGRQVFK